MKKSKLLLTSLGTLGIASTFAIPMVSCGDPQKYIVSVTSRFEAHIDKWTATENEEFDAKVWIDGYPEGRDYGIYEVTVSVGQKTLVEDVDYTVQYYTGAETHSTIYLHINKNVVKGNVTIIADPGRVIEANEYCKKEDYQRMPADGLSSEGFEYTVEEAKVDDKFLFIANLNNWGGDQSKVPNNYSFHSPDSQSAPIAEWCEAYVYQNDTIYHLKEGQDYQIVKVGDWIESIQFISTSETIQQLTNDGYVVLAVDEQKQLITIENLYYFVGWYQE